MDIDQASASMAADPASRSVPPELSAKPLARSQFSRWPHALAMRPAVPFEPSSASSRRETEFSQFVARWMELVAPHHSPSTVASERSDLRAWQQEFKGLILNEITSERLQAIVTAWSRQRSAKTVRNRLVTLRLVWKAALAWGYVQHDPIPTVIAPRWYRSEQPQFTVADIRRLMRASSPPYDTVWWLLAETGIRRGELCALCVGDCDVARRRITIRHSLWQSTVYSTKSKRPRTFHLSPQLARRLKSFVHGRAKNEPLFLTKRGKRLCPDNFVKRDLMPLVEKLGLTGATHAFRHGNATLLDRANAPWKLRQQRLGHVDPATTLAYTHLADDDDRKMAERLGRYFAERGAKDRQHRLS